MRFCEILWAIFKLCHHFHNAVYLIDKKNKYNFSVNTVPANGLVALFTDDQGADSI